MRISYDEVKRLATIRERGLDFDDAPKVFEQVNFSDPDNRFDYGETRQVTLGLLDEDIVIVVWTEREDNRRIISMRKANVYERRRYSEYLARS